MEFGEFLALVKSRRSVRRFKPDPVPQECVENMLETARWAMSGGNAQPWEFVVVTDPDARAKIGKAIEERTERTKVMEATRVEEIRHTGGRPGDRTQGDMVAQAPVIIVVCGDLRLFQVSPLSHIYISGELDIFHMNLGNASMMIHLAAAAQGLGSAWVTVERIAENQIKHALNIPDEFRIHNLVLVGYPGYKPPSTYYRRELSEIAHWEKYDRSRYRSDQDVVNWIVQLRKRSTMREGLPS